MLQKRFLTEHISACIMIYISYREYLKYFVAGIDLAPPISYFEQLMVFLSKSQQHQMKERIHLTTLIAISLKLEVRWCVHYINTTPFVR